MFLVEFLGNLLITLIDVFRRTAVNVKIYDTGMFQCIELHSNDNFIEETFVN